MDSSGLDKSGWVNKKAQVMPSWNPRYIVSDPINLRLKYYKERPNDLATRERGELKLTNCTVSVDQSNNTSNSGEHRFLVTSSDHRKTFHLEVPEQYEMQEWMRVIRLISDLGVTKQRILEEHKCADNFQTFKFATETLLQSLENQATESRRSLDRIAQQKWKSKCRLVELRDEMEEKHRTLRIKQQEMKAQEKSFREELSHLNQTLYVLQQQVRRSNELQQEIVEIFGNNQETNKSTEDKAKDAILLCRALLSKSSQQSRYLSSHKSTPNEVIHTNSTGGNIAGDDDSKQHSSNMSFVASAVSGSALPKPPSRINKGRARSYSDLTVSKSDVFEDEMAKIILDAFPGLVLNIPPVAIKENNAYELQNSDVIKIFELYHRYYVEVHLPREMELRKVRTKCEQKYNSLKYVSNKKELARREEDEIDWVMMEMKRAIDRLNREGVSSPANEKKRSGNKNNNHRNGNQEPNHYQPPLNVHRNSSTMIPVLAHRSTWSEASDTIFQLNVARQQQYQATKDLEESLKSREVVKSWYEEKIAHVQ